MPPKMADTIHLRGQQSLILLVLITSLIQGCGSIPQTVTPMNPIQLFNGTDLTGWTGLIAPPSRKASLSPSERTKEQEEADRLMLQHWHVEDNSLFFDGKGSHLVTQEEFEDFELCLEWKITPGGASGIYLRALEASTTIKMVDPSLLSRRIIPPEIGTISESKSGGRRSRST